MSKWNLIVDVAACTNCNACVLACQDEYVGNRFAGYAAEMPKHGHRWIDIKRKERGRHPMVDVAYLPLMCQHCEDAPCAKAAKDGAVKKRADGIVIIDPEKAKGQKQIVEACPFGAIWWNEQEQLPQHWIFDAHLLDAGWAEPRAATVCPTAAIRAVRAGDAEMEAMARREELEGLRPDLGIKTRVWYKNLWRYSKCFIGGSVEAAVGDKIDCVEGARVTLYRGTAKVGETATDAYGDFKLDRLDADSGAHRVEIAAPGRPPKSFDVTLGESVYLGEIRV